MYSGKVNLTLDRGRTSPTVLYDAFGQQGDLAWRSKQAVFVIGFDGLARRRQVYLIDEQTALLLGRREGPG